MKNFTDYIIENKYDTEFEADIKVALDAVKHDKFNLFAANFKKNNNTFPYIKQEQVSIGYIKNNDKTIALIAYAYPDNLNEYRESHEDDHINSGHIFDFEILEQYRGQKLGDLLINGVINEMKKHNIKGITLMAINKKVASYYESKYGFKCYKGDENVESPMMYKKL